MQKNLILTLNNISHINSVEKMFSIDEEIYIILSLIVAEVLHDNLMLYKADDIHIRMMPDAHHDLYNHILSNFEDHDYINNYIDAIVTHGYSFRDNYMYIRECSIYEINTIITSLANDKLYIAYHILNDKTILVSFTILN